MLLLPDIWGTWAISVASVEGCLAEDEEKGGVQSIW